MKTESVVRAFAGTDVYMAQTARVTHNLIKLELDLFTNFDTTITQQSLEDYYESIVLAEEVVADSAIIDQQVSLTESVNEVMGMARTKYNQIRYFVLKAFPNSIGVQGEFGLNDYMKARKNVNQMGQFLKEMQNACEKYESILVSRGCKKEEISAISEIRDKLISHNTTQKVFKKQRPKLTEDRIIILNNCYATTVELMAAAQFVYADDYAKRNQFVYTPSVRTNDGEEFTGEVAPKATDLVTKVEYEADSILLFRNTGTVSLTFALSNSDVLEGNEVELAGGATISKTMEELNAGANSILVRNNDSAITGSYMIEIEY